MLPGDYKKFGNIKFLIQMQMARTQNTMILQLINTPNELDYN